MSNREIRWVGTGAQSHEFFDLSEQLGGFIGSSVLIAHRTKASDSILYSYFLEKAISRDCAVFFPFREPQQLPNGLDAINIQTERIETRKKYRGGKIYRLPIESYETDAPKLHKFYTQLLLSKTRNFPIAIVFDTLKKWTSSLDDDIRFLLRESPMAQGSVWIHCPLANVPTDLLSVFANVIVIWPSENDIKLLNSHFPSEKIPAPDTTHQQYNNRMLVFYSKPLNERGWKWKRFSSND